MPERFFKLSNYPGSLGLSCNEDGVALAGVSLTSCGGKYVRPRSRAELQILMARAYGVEADTSRLEAGLSAIAKALNTGEIARAMAAAVLLRLPDLDWEGAVRIAQAEEMLVKYSEDQPRDWHGRWTAGSEDGSIASPNIAAPRTLSPSAQSLDENVGSEALAEDVTADAERPENDGDHSLDTSHLALPDNWVHLPSGQRIDELADFAEWIANARPEDGPALRAEAKRLFYDVGDTYGGDAVNAIISDALEPGLTTENRQELLDSLDRYTHTDPAEMAQLRMGFIAGSLLMAPGLFEAPVEIPPVEAAPVEASPVETSPVEVAPVEAAPVALDAELLTPSPVWKLGWAARGQIIDKFFGNTLGFNFPIIDAFEDGIVTGIKSVDLNAATYQDGARLLSIINKYVDQISRFDGAKWNNVEVESSAIEGRTLRLVIPKGNGTAEQQAAISAATVRAAMLNRGVNIIVSPF